jgi:hypothetical protein
MNDVWVSSIDLFILFIRSIIAMIDQFGITWSAPLRCAIVVVWITNTPWAQERKEQTRELLPLRL